MTAAGRSRRIMTQPVVAEQGCGTNSSGLPRNNANNLSERRICSGALAKQEPDDKATEARLEGHVLDR
jgi:hypothetical protein